MWDSRLAGRCVRVALTLGLTSGLSGCLDDDALAIPEVACVIAPDDAAQDLADNAKGVHYDGRAASSHVGPWTSGHGLAVHGDTLYVADTDNDAVVAIDRVAWAQRRSWHVGGGPAKLVVGPKGMIFAAQAYGDSVVRIDPSADAGPGAVTQWYVGASVTGVALSPDGATLLVTARGPQQVLALDASTGKLLGSASTRSRPTAVACNATTVVVTHQADAALTLPLSALRSGVVKGAGKAALNAAPTSRRCNLDMDADRIASRALSVSVAPDTQQFAIAHVNIAPGTPGAAPQPNAENNPNNFGAAPTAEDVYCSAFGARAANSPSLRPSAMLGYGGSSAVNSSCRDAVRPVDPTLTVLSPAGADGQAGWSHQTLRRLNGRPLAALVDSPADVVHDPKRALVYVAGSGTDNVLVLSDVGAPLGLFRVGAFPRALAVSPDGDTLYVLEGHNFKVAEVSLKTLPAQGTVTEPLQRTATRRIRYGDDPLPHAMRLGRRVFSNANNRRLVLANAFACATCHPGGEDDQITWFVADGPRQTPSLAGRLKGTGPFTWSGAAPFLADAMRDSVSRVGGAGLTKTEMSSLVAYLERGLRPAPEVKPRAHQAAAIARGQQLFYDAGVGCGSCHLGGVGTDAKSHDVGTATVADKVGAPGTPRFNTPSLRGVALTAPYFHDGSAATLRQAIDQTASTMGHASNLSDAQRDDLVAYLRTL